MSRRVRIIGLALLALSAAAVLGYFIVNRLQTSLTPPDTIGTLPRVGDDAFSPITPSTTTSTRNDVVITPNLSDVRTYHTYPDGTVVVMTSNGVITQLTTGSSVTLSGTEIGDIIDASFSYDGRYVLVLFGKPSAPELSIFSVNDVSWRPFRGTFMHARWAPHTNTIAYFSTLPSGEMVLNTIDTTATTPRPRPITTLQARDLRIIWPLASTILLTQPASSEIETSIWSVAVTTGSITPLVRPERALTSIWGGVPLRGVLWIGTPTIGGNMYIAGDRGARLAQLTFTTIPEKCTFTTVRTTISTTTSPLLVCAVPRNQERAAGQRLPEAYYDGSFSTADQIIAVDLETQSVVYSSPTDADAWDLTVTGETLSFIDHLDGNRVHQLPFIPSL